ncbi:c-type cytochrome [Gluconacetobacter azotocaptans]|uniref:C-type cytochrome n=1 Tax=Gluconacetobacter azotocaptans TaxID=142834 RepID=A0A7W4JSY3_9PROT|nr:c-type cytochrome [Gluconacetobacter azotocaptans]MBB2190324.1 c-type cytochrome [Gluconacetobacter azotocaptans]MBM9400642.1 c-type cytochrome [Gluconacetobacter azotocaptans]GBQ27512.1 cytochrome c [Gluconacetobacter azotocaptans DSM 13594]
MSKRMFLFLTLSALAGGPVIATSDAAETPFANLVQHGDRSRGRDLADSMCSDCHNFDRGGAAMIGPNLYAVQGRPIASMADFNFSPALQAHKPQVWTADTLSAWLKNPAAFAPGTRMALDGITDDRDRADIVAYLESLSDGK